jgi:hypothetical protein
VQRAQVRWGAVCRLVLAVRMVGGPPPVCHGCNGSARRASPVRGRRARARCCNSGGVVPELNVGLRLGQSGRHRCRVAFTCPMDAAHPERRSDALHKSHPKQQHRIDPAIERRRVSKAVCCFECLCHGRDYTATFCPTGSDHNHPPNSGGKWLSGNDSSILFPTNWNITIQHMWALRGAVGGPAVWLTSLFGTAGGLGR